MGHLINWCHHFKPLVHRLRRMNFMPPHSYRFFRNQFTMVWQVSFFHFVGTSSFQVNEQSFEFKIYSSSFKPGMNLPQKLPQHSIQGFQSFTLLSNPAAPPPQKQCQEHRHPGPAVPAERLPQLLPQTLPPRSPGCKGGLEGCGSLGNHWTPQPLINLTLNYNLLNKVAWWFGDLVGMVVTWLGGKMDKLLMGRHPTNGWTGLHPFFQGIRKPGNPNNPWWWQALVWTPTAVNGSNFWWINSKSKVCQLGTLQPQ